MSARQVLVALVCCLLLGCGATNGEDCTKDSDCTSGRCAAPLCPGGDCYGLPCVECEMICFVDCRKNKPCTGRIGGPK